MCEKILGIAGITQQPHKFQGFVSSGELQAVPHTWLRVGNLHEPHGVGNRPLGNGKMGVQESDLESRGVFDLLAPHTLWLLASMDVNMWHEKQINKPDGDPFDAVGNIARDMLQTKNRRIGVSNILTTRVYGEKNRRVGWRDAFMLLTPSLVNWMADTDKMIRAIERGDLKPDTFTNESSGGLRWDRFIWESLKVGSKNQEKLSVFADGRTVVVDDRESAKLASILMQPFFRSVAPGLKEAAYAAAMRVT